MTCPSTTKSLTSVALHTRSHAKSFRHYLTATATKTLICALVLARLDYCNSLLAGSPKHIIDKLQKVQNSAARLAFRAKKLDHIPPLLHSLHWLPVQARIEYKLSVLYHFFSDSCPSYLADLLSVYSPSRTLRFSADTLILKVPVTRTKTYGQRAFAYSAVELPSLPYPQHTINAGIKK